MNIYEAIVMTVFAASTIILAISNYNTHCHSEEKGKMIARLSAENEKLKAENRRLTFGKQMETFFVSIVQDKPGRDRKI